VPLSNAEGGIFAFETEAKSVSIFYSKLSVEYLQPLFVLFSKLKNMSNTAYQIVGGNPVVGEITCYGAKNFATKAMIAALLGSSATTLTNVPPIGDVAITADMLRSLGVTVVWDKAAKMMTIDPTTATDAHVRQPHSGANRMPILMIGALLHRFDEVSVPMLGGCVIGARGVDFHLDAIQDFGAKIEEGTEGYIARKKERLRGSHFHLKYPSVGATETALFLASMATGTSVIQNVAIEPEIMELVTMLRAMGAVIFTNSNREFRIEGVAELRGCTMNILGDRIETASWASMAAAVDGSITVHGIRPETLGNFLSSYRQAGGGFELLDYDSIRFFRASKPQAIHIETDVWPGFSTDWQQPFAIFLTQAAGVSVIHETVYENRFGYLKALKKLGADVQLATHCLGPLPCRFSGKGHEHSAIISGVTPLTAVEEPLVIPDLRAGLAYVIAAAVAKGTTLLRGVPMIERGYGDIIPRLQALGLKIEKIDMP
jgi:UDP-N-acetylglucosamine 1-carboxyvinyltransferase